MKTKEIKIPNKKYVEIRIFKDPKMFWSEWIIFFIGIVFIGGIITYGLSFIMTLTNENLKGLYMIVFTYVLMKLIYWIRVPSEYATSLVESHYQELGIYPKGDKK